MSPEPEDRVDDNQNLVVDLDASPPDETKPVAAKPPPVPGPGSVSPQVGLTELEKQIETERRARERAQQDTRRLQAERDQAMAYAQDAERRGATNWEQQVDTHIAHGQEQMEALTLQQEAAYNDGDFKTVAEINRKLSHLGGQLGSLEREKANYLHQRERAAQQQQHVRQQSVQPEQPTDPVERAIQGRTDATKAFLRKHPELIRSDGTIKRVALDAHERALDAGLAVDTHDYFDYIEKSVTPAGPSEVLVPARQSSEPGGTAAPVSRGSGPGSNGTFVMTPRMRKLAEEQGVTPQEWATNYVRLLKEGRITPIT
jgi:hypothetical protein